MSAQVRIGGDGEPYTAAVLDLNADDDATPTANKGALALPRVSLNDNTAQLNGTEPIAGMLVYNTNVGMTGGDGVGVYFWDGSLWVAIGGDGTVGNEVTDATSGGGLVRAGSGTAGDPYTLAIADNAVTTSRIANDAVTSAKIANGTIATADIADSAVTRSKTSLKVTSVGYTLPPTGSSLTVPYPFGCNSGNSWAVHTSNSYVALTNLSTGVAVYNLGTASGAAAIVFYCF